MNVNEPVVVIVDVAVLEGDVLQGERLHPRQLQVAEVRGLAALIPENHFPACYLQLVRSAGRDDDDDGLLVNGDYYPINTNPYFPRYSFTEH